MNDRLRLDESWPVGRLAASPLPQLGPGCEPVDLEWRPLQRAWNGERSDNGFQPGWARIRWTPTLLIYDAVFHGSGQRNRARTLNECTWELGDVGEIFIQAEGAPGYVEIHVTPENQRLQLQYPAGGIDAVRAGRATLANFMVSDPEWVQSAAADAGDCFRIHVRVPVTIIGVVALDTRVAVRSTVCRYDYRGRADMPVLSSTAALRSPSFHAPADWSRLYLEAGACGATSVVS